jgi:diguanylate cyclase
VTESVMMQDHEKVSAIFERLSQLGVELSIDDFGTGYSNLFYLLRLHADVLKIDRSFITDVVRSEEGAGIVNAVIQMAKVLGLRVVAEGTETAEQVEFLRLAGCSHAQGFLFAQPLPADEFKAYLRDQMQAQAIPGPIGA